MANRAMVDTYRALSLPAKKRTRHDLLYTGEMNKRRDDNGKLVNFCVAYQDDLIWWSETEADHKEMTER
eukprot:COSAG06_NODE_29469_length_555_cov_11.923246_2_plen_68_part_01